ncbi:MAG TPA: pilus assembly protein PilC [Opitutae bacterium]|nr:pilus assembly protein PilC [Opitutae bacterium]HCY58169.1 pilus assembly protein PilC [Opitutae bacterium]|tara:strand:- start:1525 stop:2844 length:1320 start_codon:yes stop_codon:yes gene_type:complete
MPIFQYVATDQTGAQTQGSYEAANEEQALAQLAQYGLTVTQLVPTQSAPEVPSPAQPEKKQKKKKEKAPKPSKAAKKKKKKGGLLAIEIGGGPTSEDISIFTRQMSTLVHAGLPLLRSLEVMIKQQEKKPKFKAMLEAISEKVSSGGNLSDGLAMYPKTFDNLYVNMVRAGEAGGVLELVLDRLAQFQEKSIRTIKKVKSAMIYPSVIMFVAVGIVTLLMMVVVPQFQTIFEQMLRGAPLPGPTQIVIGISELFSTYPLLVLGGMGGTVGGLLLFKKTKIGAKTFDWLGLNVPAVRDVVGKSNISRITRTFGTLMSSGVPILQALQITRDTLSNTFFMKAMSNVHDSVRDGEAMAVQMGRETVFPTMVTSMVEIGEETGELPDMLTRIADNYDEDVDNAVAGMTSLIEPVMIVFLAVAVGFIVIALFLPIVAIIETIGK